MKRAFREFSLLFAASLSLIPGPYVFANPTGFDLQAGVVEVPTISGNDMIINQSSHAAVINWDSFSIGLGESTTFNQPNGGATMNRVVGLTPSMINGALNANGSIWLINPNGTLVGNAGIIQTGSFLASTLDVGTGEFMNYANGVTDAVTFSGSSSAGIRNLGQIRASAGDVMLFARHVDNAGVIAAPNGDAGLAAGQEITLVKSGAERIQVKPASAGEVGGTGVSNSGTIEAVQAELKANGGNIYAMAVNNSGAVRATGAVMQGGKIRLSAGGGSVTNSGSLTATSGTQGGDIQVTGKDVRIASGSNINASGATGGGEVLIGGDYQGKGTVPTAQTTVVEAGATISADATQNGDGGKVIVWADGATLYQGHISARGGVAGGNGGFAEVSGKNWLGFAGLADLTAQSGKVGTLLLDPSNMTINDTGPDALFTGVFTAGPPTVFGVPTGPTASSTLTWTTILTQLGLADLIITTSGTAGDAGNISITEGKSFNEANNLTFLAHNNISLTAGQSITNNGTGGVSFQAGWDGVNATAATFAATGGIILGAGSNITLTGGNLTMRAGSGGIAIAGNLSTAGTGVINLGTADVSVAGNSTVGGTSTGQITVGNATLVDGATLTVGAGSATPVSLTAVSGTLLGVPSNLTINTTGAVTVSGAVGTDIGTVTVTNSGGTTFQSTLNAESAVLTNTTGTIAFQGNATLTTGLTTAAQGYAVSFTGGTNTIAGDTNFLNTGAVTLGNDAGDTVTFTGGLDTTTGPSGTNVAGIVQTTNTQMDLEWHDDAGEHDAAQRDGSDQHCVDHGWGEQLHTEPGQRHADRRDHDGRQRDVQHADDLCQRLQHRVQRDDDDGGHGHELPEHRGCDLGQ